jgi:hypothetical protein
MRLTIAAIGSPGARRGMMKISVEPNHTVRTYMPNRRMTYVVLRPRISGP